MGIKSQAAGMLVGDIVQIVSKQLFPSAKKVAPEVLNGIKRTSKPDLRLLSKTLIDEPEALPAVRSIYENMGSKNKEVSNAAHLELLTSLKTFQGEKRALIDDQNVINLQKYTKQSAPEPVRNTTTGITEADKKIADDYIASSEGQKYLEDQRVRKGKRLEDEMGYRKRSERPYKRSAAKAGEEVDPLAYEHKGRYIKDMERVRREVNDATTTADPRNVEEFFDDPIQAQTGYQTKAGPRNPGRDPALGFKPTNKDLETGATYTDLLSQHHILFNDDAGALVSQQVFKEDPAFLVAIQRYIAQRYDSAFGEAAKNMANLPQNAVHTPYHTWLRKLQIDGIGGKNYEQFWKQKLLENPNMNAQEIQDAVDEWFEEVIYPSIVMLDNFMKNADPKTFSKREVSFPKKLLKQAKASIENDMNKIKPTAEPGTTAYDVQMDDLHTRAQRGEFNERRAWFTDSKARKDAAETL